MVNHVPMTQPVSYRTPAIGSGATMQRTARAEHPDRFESGGHPRKAIQPKFGGAGGAAFGAMTGGVIGGIAAAMIGIPSLLLGFFIHPLLLVALASPLLIPAGIAIGAMMGKGGGKK